MFYNPLNRKPAVSVATACLLSFVVCIFSCNHISTDAQAGDSTTATTASSMQRNNAVITDSIKAVNDRIIAAASIADADKVMMEMSHTAGFSFINQDAIIIRGWDSMSRKVHSGYATVAYRNIKPADISVTVLSADYAIAKVLTSFSEKDKDSTSFSAAVAWTLLFVREEGGWKVLHGQQSVKRDKAGLSKH
jgi:ketosteroid isomerase-like protein